MRNEDSIPENVQTLINKLHHEGVKAGKQEAEEILKKVKKEAAEIVDAAKREAEHIKVNAHQLIEDEKQAAYEAFNIAIRDTVLTLKSQLFAQFKNHLQKLIGKTLDDEVLLKDMIVKIAAASISEEKNEIAVLVGKIENYEEKRDQLIESIATQMAQKGIKLGKTNQKGIKIVFEEDGVQIDLSEEALSDLIYQLLIPRYQEIFDGVKS